MNNKWKGEIVSNKYERKLYTLVKLAFISSFSFNDVALSRVNISTAVLIALPRLAVPGVNFTLCLSNDKKKIQIKN